MAVGGTVEVEAEAAMGVAEMVVAMAEEGLVVAKPEAAERVDAEAAVVRTLVTSEVKAEMVEEGTVVAKPEAMTALEMREAEVRA